MINIIFISAALFLLWRADIPNFINTVRVNNTVLHLFLASTLIITLLAFVKTGSTVTMPLHFLGLTSLTLILGQRFALIACAISAMLLLITQKLAFEQLGILLLGGMMLPVMAIDYLRQLLSSKTHKTWQFITFVVSLSAIVSLVVKTSVLAVYYHVINGVALPDIINGYVSLSLLFWVPEIMLNGTIILTLIQHKPHWVSSYHPQPSNT